MLTMPRKIAHSTNIGILVDQLGLGPGPRNIRQTIDPIFGHFNLGLFHGSDLREFEPPF